MACHIVFGASTTGLAAPQNPVVRFPGSWATLADELRGPPWQGLVGTPASSRTRHLRPGPQRQPQRCGLLVRRRPDLGQ